MKKHLKSFIHKPALVTGVSLVIALAVGAYAYSIINVAPEHEFITATAGSIASNATTDGDSQHVSLGFLAGGRVQSLSVKVGDTVKKGQVLATLDAESTLGAITQAQAAYAAAQANYQKVQNGATDSTINVANTSVTTAQQNLDHLIQNGYTQIDSLVRTNVDNLYMYPNSDNPEFGLSFFDASTNSTVTIRPNDSNTRLNLRFERIAIAKLLADWKVAPLTDRNAATQMTLKNLQTVQSYLIDLSTALNTLSTDAKYQANIDKAKASISTARLSVDTMITNIQNAQTAIANAQTGVAAVTTSARPEDIKAAQAQMTSALGALQVAQSAYNNRIILSPGEGTVTAVRISIGEIATANATAIELTGKNFSKDVAIMVPKSAISEKNGRAYVLVESGEEKEVTLGASDSQNVEIISGIAAGEKVAIQ